MPWTNQGGSGGGGGPWGGSGGGGTGPRGRGSGGQQPPNLEDLLRQGQDNFKRFMPRGFRGARGLVFILIGIIIIWLMTGIYTVGTAEQGVVLRFGKWVATTGPGLHYHLPAPIESALTPEVQRINNTDIGFQTLGGGARDTKRDIPKESLMLTGDQNIIDIDLAVLWKIQDAGQYLFNIRDPDATVKIAAESAIREIIGKTDMQPALTEGRDQVEDDTRILLQNILDEYEAGILITQLKLQEVKVPDAVIDAFDDVQRAIQDRDRIQNEADAYRNDILPRARGEAVQAVQEAEAYKEKVINEALGEAKRFLSVYNEYKLAKDVTIRRLYLETMESVFRGTPKFIIGGGEGGTNVAPYLPLPLPMPQQGVIAPGGRASTGSGG